jgi:hypothetical protein
METLSFFGLKGALSFFYAAPGAARCIGRVLIGIIFWKK